MTTQTDSLVVKLDADVKKFEQKILAAESSVDKLGVSAGKATKKVGGMGRNAGMAGIQFQQFIGQVQGGQSAMLALSQQSADLGFVLGAPLLGAVVGISASIAGILLPNLFKTNEELKKLEEVALVLAKSYNTLSAAGQAVAKDALVERLKEQKKTFNGLQNEVNKLQTAYMHAEQTASSNKLFDSLLGADPAKAKAELVAAKASLYALKLEMEKTQKALTNLGKTDKDEKVKGSTDDPTEQEIQQAKDLSVALTMQREQMNAEMIQQEQAFMAALAEIKFTGLETDEELFFKQQEIHQAMLDNKLMSEKQFAAAQARIAKDFAGELKIEEKVVKQTEAQKLNTRQTSIRAAMAINGAFLDDNKEIAAGLIVADTYTGMQKALAIDPINGWANALAIGVTGAANLAGALSSGRGGGGGISGSSGGAPSSQQSFERETSSLEVSESTSSGGRTQTMGIPDGDEIGEAIFNWIKKAEAEGRG